jgi:hypothetical protein
MLHTWWAYPICISYFIDWYHWSCAICLQRMWSLFIFIQVGSSSIWIVAQLYDTTCCIVLLAVTTLHGPCLPMPWRLPCWRVTHLSQKVTNDYQNVTAVKPTLPFTCRLLDSGTECSLLLILLVKELHGYHSEIVYTCCRWGYLHITVSTSHIYFLFFTLLVVNLG